MNSRMTTVTEMAAGNLVFLSTLIRTSKHRVVLSERVADLEETKRGLFDELLTAVRTFKNWTPDNNPNGECDFGQVFVDGVKYFFKIDLFDGPNFEYGFDPITMKHSQCHRLLTIMEASEY